LQQASETGITKLPSRDIPRDTESIINDSQIQTNYIPGPNQGQGQGQINAGATTDYIDNNENMEDLIQN
jgi:hypothetical protein